MLALILIVIIGLLELNAIKGKSENVKITSIVGVVHMGVLLTAILYFVIEFGIQKL